MTTDYFPTSRRPSQLAIRAEALLVRYPRINDQELASLIDIFPYVSMLDRGLMSADARLSEKLAAFHRDHGGKMKAPEAALIGLIAFPLIMAAGMLWWILA
ncbi:MAG TPA: hypothetical protein VNS79_10725 [Sphingobium sp.]|nr:hypothetical protein [Sphingobium sp.]